MKTTGFSIATLILGAGLVAGCQSAAVATGPIIAEADVCGPQRFEIYFADSQAGLTEPARQTIDLTASRLNGCQIKSVRVLGLADARGGSSANLSLSERRAQTVAAALKREGWPDPAFEVQAAGDQGAVSASGVNEPLRRRTEVLVDAAPR